MSTPVPTDKRGGSAVSPTGGATDTKQGSGEVLNALSGAVGGIQGAFVKAYSQMAGSMAQSMTMMQTMNTMMEDVLVQNVKISTLMQFKDGQENSGPCVALTVRNTSSLPIPNITISLSVQAKGSEEVAKNVIVRCVSKRLQSATINKRKRKHADGKEPSSAKQAEAETSSFSEAPFTLAPRSTSSWELSLQPHEVDQYNIIVQGVFASPGTARELKVNHHCGLYLLHQCSVTACSARHSAKDQAPGKVNVSETVASAAFIRQVLRVPPADGLLIVQNTGDVGARARGYLLTSPKATSLAGECSNVWLELLSGNDTDPTSLTVRCTGLNEGEFTASQIIDEIRVLGAHFS